MAKRENIIKLFDKYSGSNFSAKNRFVRSATWLGSADEGGAMTRDGAGRLFELAAGGVGTIIAGAAYVSREGKVASHQLGADCDDRVRDIAALVGGIHAAGSKLIVQLCHAGGQGIGPVLFAPSEGVQPGAVKFAAAAAAHDISKIRMDFAAAALRAKNGGADGVEIHAGHGFLITQFLSPSLNRRGDAYGGSLENRMRLLREIYSDMRTAVGADFPIWLKLSMAEGTEGGYTSEDGAEVAKTLLRDGADGIEISYGSFYAGTPNSPLVIGVSAGEFEAPFEKYAAELKEYFGDDKLVILTGGLRSLDVMAELIQKRSCDLLGISRPLIAEPDLINRWAEEDSRPSACLSCNACFKTSASGMVGCPIIVDRNEGNWDPVSEC